jgi:tRNA threonylcarbamoyladenosine biosynthesis protein TsaB
VSERLLLLETSGRSGLVALAEGETVCAVRRLDEARRHARDLAPTVAELLAERGWAPRDLTAVVVGRGPGSYTGLRVGLMAAMTLAYATGCALVALETFAVLAHQAPNDVLLLDVIADAQQGKVYRQAFARPAAGAPLRAVSPLTIEPFQDWVTAGAPPACVTGPGLRAYRSRLPAGVVVLDESLGEPQALSLLRLGRARLAAGERDDPLTVEPLYLRPSSAEEKWQALGKP